MIADIESEKIDCVITKDLSRLGRNYAKVGNLLDEYFPEHNVRYIAVIDDFDSASDYNDELSVFRNVFNEFYPRDISKKVKQVKKQNAQNGDFNGSRAPYGYKKAPDDIHRLIIDEDVADVVRSIFEAFASGQTGREIAETLNRKDILSPGTYRDYVSGKNTYAQRKWSSQMIYLILRNRVYAGDMIQNKRVNVSFKCKKRRVTDESEWIVVRGTHEAIIDEDTWTDIQSKLQKGCGTRRKRDNSNKKFPVFSGLIYCADCGHRLGASWNTTQYRYRCGNYASNGKDACTAHYIKENDLIEYISQEIEYYSYQIQKNKKSFSNKLFSVLYEQEQISYGITNTKYSKTKKRNEEVRNMLMKLYEDKCGGVITQSMFNELSKGYNAELENLLTLSSEYSKIMNEQKTNERLVLKIVDVLGSFSSRNDLTREYLSKLVDKITIGEKDEFGKRNISIVYKVVGNLSDLLADCAKMA